jgi:hypothetical protein
MPPSIHVHKTLYEWEDGHDPWTVPPAPLPDVVLGSIRLRTTDRPWRDAALNDPDRADPNALVYDLATTQRIATALYRKAIRTVRSGEGRNNTLYKLARQLDSLGMTQAEVLEWGRAFAREVRNG